MGLPTFAGMALCAALLTSVIAQLTRSRGPLASSLHDVDASTRRHVAHFIGLLVAAAVAASLSGTLHMVGIVLRQISGVPMPAIDGVYSRQELAYTEPLGTLSLGISWLGWGWQRSRSSSLGGRAWSSVRCGGPNGPRAPYSEAVRTTEKEVACVPDPLV